ncbi:hypothetical protein XIS1_520004 [Xenorhabdus innexi]|uniref:Uncharacterized protein n=1 Tax=Xenorhabdus innexi TaxID=290109 RepID=A0A1N6MZ47_9GAMM|nr:hypothetical protein XIS1_520004 [Xenorhabdus innexi]
MNYSNDQMPAGIINPLGVRSYYFHPILDTYCLMTSSILLNLIN